MKIVEMNLKNNPYNVYIENDILLNSYNYISKVYNGKKVYIISDTRVSSIYLNKLKEVLEPYYEVFSVIVDEGEKSKSFETYTYVLKQLLDLDIRRNELLIALGGGVVGDLTGFVASSIYRGIPYINIPTSLLSQMDSSIGGKTGIDFYNRKNIIGAFKQPSLVLIDPKVLNTLSDEQFSNGMAELIKHAVIGDKELFDILKNKPSIDEDIIYRSLSVKQKLVLEDEFDQGNRMILNFGHTFGHIIELEKNFLHGYSVGLGMLMALKLGSDLRITDIKLYDEVKNILSIYGLDCSCYDYHKYLNQTIYDKKNLKGIVNFILIKDIGCPIIYKIDEDKLKEINNEC